MARRPLTRGWAIVAFGAAFACGGARPPAPRARPATSVAADGGAEAGAPVDAVPTLDAIAARAATLAPLMREIARWDRAGPRSPDVRADRDLCVRAAFAAGAPVRAWIEDASGARRGDVAEGADGMVPPRGPACVARGASVRLVVEGAGAATARAVLFGAP